MNFGEPLTNLLALGFGLGAFVAKMEGLPFVEFIGPGLLASTAMNAVTFDMAFEAFDRINDNGIYRAMITAPLTAQEIVAGEYLWEAVRSVLYGVIFGLVLAGMGLVKSWWALALPIPLAISGVMFAAPALWVALKAKTHEQLFYYFTLVVTPMFMFSGVFFPARRLPGPLRDLVQLTPLYHLVRLSRDLALGLVQWHMIVDILWIIGYAVVLAVFPVRVLARRLTV